MQGNRYPSEGPDIVPPPRSGLAGIDGEKSPVLCGLHVTHSRAIGIFPKTAPEGLPGAPDLMDKAQIVRIIHSTIHGLLKGRRIFFATGRFIGHRN